MANSAYMNGRKKYGRPQAMLWADNPGYISNGFYVPEGNELNSANNFATQDGEFIILSDDNRQPISFNQQRIEKRERMINGRMRSYHIADKLEISTSWEMLPSRSFSSDPLFNNLGKTALETKGKRVGYLDPKREVKVTYEGRGYVTVPGETYLLDGKYVTLPEKLVYLPGDVVYADVQKEKIVAIPGKMFWENELEHDDGKFKVPVEEKDLWQGEYSAALVDTYLIGDVVSYNGFFWKYIILDTSENPLPPSMQSPYWEKTSYKTIREVTETVRIKEPPQKILYPGNEIFVDGKIIKLPDTKMFVEGTKTVTIEDTGTRATTVLSQQYTTDGGAGGMQILDWYENHKGSFWVYLAYDKYENFRQQGDTTPYDNLAKYSQVTEVFFSDFSYELIKRGSSNYDFWNISVTLEEA
jgi:hypothetical protein